MKPLMHTLAAVVLLAAGVAAAPARADEGGRCHFHGSKPASESVVLGCAAQRRDSLVTAGKLDQGWKGVGHESIQAVEGKKGKEWRVTFRNPAATDPARATLYMFFTLPGNFIAANFTGR